MKPSREPYGKRACAFTDGFTLTFPATADAPETASRVIRFDHDWCTHFAPPPSSPESGRRSSSHGGDYHLVGRRGWR
ncbi:MAG: hypothetical protein IT532_00840 [Burkholderiales bacterium]|nr:hypothetical protein [Burkholderiales bacterium]